MFRQIVGVFCRRHDACHFYAYENFKLRMKEGNRSEFDNKLLLYKVFLLFLVLSQGFFSFSGQMSHDESSKYIGWAKNHLLLK